MVFGGGLGRWGKDFETGLAGTLEEEGEGAVVGMRACANVDVGLVVEITGRVEGGIVEEAESATTGTAAVAGGEVGSAPGGGFNLSCVSV